MLADFSLVRRLRAHKTVNHYCITDMKHVSYTPMGTCSRQIDFDIDSEGRLHNVRFTGGCAGNTVGVALLAEGMTAAEAASRLRGVPCRDKGTSCPDQLARAIEQNI